MDDQRRLWVERWRFPDELPVTDVYDVAGRYLGTLSANAIPLGALHRNMLLFPHHDPTTGVVRRTVTTLEDVR